MEANLRCQTMLGATALMLSFARPSLACCEDVTTDSRPLASLSGSRGGNSEPGAANSLQQQLNALQQMLEQQNKVIEHLQRQLDDRLPLVDDGSVTPVLAGPTGANTGLVTRDELDRRSAAAIAHFDEEAKKPWAVPYGVQTGYNTGQGFYIRSVADPKWDNWEGKDKIPFELR